MENSRSLLPVIIAISFVSAIGGLVFNTMPLLLGAAKDSAGLTTEQLGTLSLLAGLGYLSGTVSAPLWVEKVNWRIAAFVIAVLAALSFFAASKASGAAIYGAWIAFGFFCSLAIALAMRALADMPNPERAYGTRLTVELLSIGILLSVLPIYFIAKFGFSGAMHGLAITALLFGLGAFLMPKRSAIKTDGAAFPAIRDAGRAYVMLAIFVVYLFANVGLYYFLNVISEKFSPSGEQVALMFTVLKWLGGAAGFVGAVIGMRAGIRPPHFISAAILLIGVAGLLLAKSMTQFMIASWVWEFGFTLGCLYATAAIVRFDPSNKLVMLVPAGFGIASMTGGKAAGQLLAGGSPNGLYMLVIVCTILPSLFMLFSRITAPAQQSEV